MNPIAIQCANCGAKYKLPETFAGDKAKCKACGSTIDVKAARSGGTAPAPAPAPKPVTASRPAAAPAEAAAPASPSRASSRSGSSRRGKDEGEAAGGRAGRSGRSSSRGGGEAPKKDNKALLFGGLGLGVVIVGVVAWLVLGGKKDAANQGDTANGTPPAANAPSGDEAKKAADEKAAQEKAAQEKAAQEKAEQDKAKLAADKKKADDAKAAVAKEPAKTPEDAKEKGNGEVAKTDDKSKPEDKPKDANASKSDAPAEKAKFAKKGLTSKDQVFDPKKELQPLAYEEGTSDDLKKELEELVETAATGGASAKNKAKVKLAAAGYPAMTAIINKLRELDYFDSDQCMTAFELNKHLEAMTLGVNAQFVPVNLGANIDFDLADFNAKTVQAWQKFMKDTAPTKARFDEILKTRKTRNTDEAKKKDESGGEEIK